MKKCFISFVVLVILQLGCDKTADPIDDGGVWAVTGKILDAEKLTPLSGLLVVLDGARDSTTTKDNGSFIFSGVKSEVRSISISGLGISDTTILLPSNVTGHDLGEILLPSRAVQIAEYPLDQARLGWQLNGLSLSNDVTISGDEINTTRDMNGSMTYLPGGPITTNFDDVDVLLYPHQFSAVWFYKEMPIFGPTGTGSYKIAGGESPKSSGSLQLSLSQNPASLQTTATLVGLSDHNVNLRLYDMLGRELLGLQPLVMNGAAVNEQIQLGQLSSGRYILVADQDTGDRVQMMLSVEH